MTQILKRQPRWVPITIVLGTATAYELAFASLHQLAGDGVAVFTVIPVAVAGWLLGSRAGLVAGLLGSTLNIMNFTLVGKIGWEVVIGRWPALLAGLALGLMAGWAGERAAHATRESREANQERDKFFDLSMDLLCIAETDGYFKRLNPAWERALGFSREELCSKPFIEFIHPDDRSRTQDVMEKLSRGEPAINFDNRYRCLDGSYRWLSWITPAPEQEPPMFYAAARDITERKRIEEALRESEERYRLLTEATFDGIAIHDQGIMIEASSGLERMFGYGPGELIGKHVLDLVADESREMVIANMRQGGQGPYESVGRRKDGSIFYGEVVVKPCRYKGRDLRLVAGRDITERKQMEQALRQANDELEQRVAQRTQELLVANDALCHARAWQRDLIEAIPGIVWECNARTWRFSFVNHQAELVLGYPVQHWLDEPDFWQTHIHPDDRDWVIEYCLVSLRDTRKYSFDYRMIAADGRTVWLQDVVTVETDEQGPAILRGIMLDITERKRTEQALKEAHAAVELAVEGISKLDDQGHYVSVNEQYAAMAGYRPEELVGKSWETTVHPDDRVSVGVAFQQMLTCGKGETELRGVRKDGTIFYKQIVIIKPDGHLSGMSGHYCFIRDITERKQAEEALRESEARFRGLFEEVPIAYQSLDIEGRYLDANKGLCTLLGYSPDELLGKPFDDFWSPDLRQFFQDEFGSLMKSGGEIKHLRLRRKDGKEISVILNGRVQRDPRGNFLRTHCILTDITDQKLIEENLRRSKIFIDSVLENLPSMIFVKDAKDLRFLRFNKAGEELLGYRRDELLGRNDYDIFPKEEADFFITKDREVLRSGCLLDIPEEPIQTRGNGLRFLHTKKIPICGTDGTPQYLLGISEDITDRKQAEEALQQNDARLNAAQRIAHIGSWDLDLVENILTWSDENYCIFEIDSAHFGASYAAFLELVHPDDRQFVNESYTESVANRTCYNIEHRLLMSDGRVKFVHEQCETFYAPDGRPTRSIGTTQDITDRKQAVEALRKSEEQLRKVLEEREQLSQDLHDNIIQTIYAIGMSLEECRYLVQEDRRAADKKLEHAVGCLNRVISDVRMYIVWDKHEEVSGQQFCAKLAELAVTMESMQGIRFSLHLAVEAARRLTPLGAFHILHIVQEAMSNSLRHSKSRSGHVSLQMEEGRIRLEVSDDGIGFNLEEASGQGHGLQNMAARAHKLGANFQIISKPGSGAQILVELPLEDQHASASS